MQVQANKSNFYTFQTTLLNLEKENLFEDSMTNLLKDLSVEKEYYVFEKENEKNNSLDYTYFFKTEDRKRPTQIQRYLTKSLVDDLEIQEMAIVPYQKDVFYSSLRRFENSEKWVLSHSPQSYIDYDAQDIEHLFEKENFRPWQKELYDLLYDENDEIRDSNTEEIITILDKNSNSEKALFLKYLIYKSPDFSFLTFATTAQLRSSIIEEGKKRVYLINIPTCYGRNDSIRDLLAFTENLKFGLIKTHAYGRGRNNTLLMRPPHVVFFTNEHLPYENLPVNYWRVFQIDSNNKLKLVSVRNQILKQKGSKVVKRSGRKPLS